MCIYNLYWHVVSLRLGSSMRAANSRGFQGTAGRAHPGDKGAEGHAANPGGGDMLPPLSPSSSSTAGSGPLRDQ